MTLIRLLRDVGDRASAPPDPPGTRPRQYYPGDPLKWRRGDETSALFITRGDVTVAGERRRAPTLVTMDQMSMANDSTAATECEGFSISADALQAILMLDPTLLDKARAGNPEPYNV